MAGEASAIMAAPTGEAPLVSVLGILIGDPATVHIGQVPTVLTVGFMEVTIPITINPFLCQDIHHG